MSVQTTPPVGERERAGLSAPAAGGGVITIALFIVLFFVSAFLNAEIPQPDAPLKEITDWRGDNGSAIRLAGALFITSALILTAFSAWLASVVRSVGRAQDSLVIFAGGLFSALGLFLNGALQWVAERPETLRHDQAAQLLHQMVFVLGGPVVVIGSALLVTVGAGSLLRAKLLPTWFGGLGVVIGLIDLAALASLLPESVDMMILLPIGRFTSMAWLLAAAIVVTRKLGKARA
ncbi:hypothetical protein [Streptomyces sp. NPDC000410]|uniref:hypothetical protein n=1 Tax=Streptomyces sp. NPDC000410 TaxID=3154254 RepID=UPI00332E3BE5